MTVVFKSRFAAGVKWVLIVGLKGTWWLIGVGWDLASEFSIFLGARANWGVAMNYNTQISWKKHMTWSILRPSITSTWISVIFFSLAFQLLYFLFISTQKYNQTQIFFIANSLQIMFYTLIGLKRTKRWKRKKNNEIIEQLVS